MNGLIDALNNGPAVCCTPTIPRPANPGVVTTADALQLQANPNPFRDELSIRFTLPQAGPATLEVFNLRGQKVAELYNGEVTEGTHTLEFSGEAAVQFTLPKEPITLRLGYYYQKIESEDDVAPTWVDDDLGQGPRDWLNDESQGVTFGAEFRF